MPGLFNGTNIYGVVGPSPIAWTYDQNGKL